MQSRMKAMHELRKMSPQAAANRAIGHQSVLCGVKGCKGRRTAMDAGRALLLKTPDQARAAGKHGHRRPEALRQRTAHDDIGRFDAPRNDRRHPNEAAALPSQHAEGLRIVEHDVAVVWGDALQEFRHRRGTSAARAEAVGDDDRAAPGAPVLFDQGPEPGRVAMPEFAHGHAVHGRPLDAPSRNGIGSLVHVDPHSVTCEQSKKVPEQVQRRGKRRRALAAHQRGEPAGDAGTARRRLQCRGLARREPRPGAQRRTWVAQPEIERRREVEHGHHISPRPLHRQPLLQVHGRHGVVDGIGIGQVDTGRRRDRRGCSPGSPAASSAPSSWLVLVVDDRSSRRSESSSRICSPNVARSWKCVTVTSDQPCSVFMVSTCAHPRFVVGHHRPALQEVAHLRPRQQPLLHQHFDARRPGQVAELIVRALRQQQVDLLAAR